MRRSTGSSFVTSPAGAANAVADNLSSFPTHGVNFAIMSTGRADSADDPNSNVPDDAGPTNDKSTDFGGGNIRGNTDFDVSVLKVDLSVPSTANCLRFDFQFYSEEFAEYVGTQYNDAFIAELDTTTWDTSGSVITSPDNFAFGPGGNVISVNTSFTSPASAITNAAGTTYDGATPLLSAAHAVTPGAHSVYFSIFDQGDRILDSSVFLDNLQVGFVPDPTTQCVPGAQLKRFELSLAPATATRDVGTSHTVTATLRNVDDGRRSPVARSASAPRAPTPQPGPASPTRRGRRRSPTPEQMSGPTRSRPATTWTATRAAVDQIRSRPLSRSSGRTHRRCPTPRAPTAATRGPRCR